MSTVARVGVFLVAVGVMALAVLGVGSLPRDNQSGLPVPGDPRGGQGVSLTSYCLPDGSGMRAYERPFPMGGTQPLFSIVYAGDVPGPAHCEVAR